MISNRPREMLIEYENFEALDAFYLTVPPAKEWPMWASSLLSGIDISILVQIVFPSRRGNHHPAPVPAASPVGGAETDGPLAPV